LNVHGVYDVRQTEIHTAEALVPELSAFVVEMAIEKIKRHKSPGIDQVPVGQIKAGSRKIPSGIHKLINSVWNKEQLPEKLKESIVVFMYNKGDKTGSNNYRGISFLSTTYKILSSHLMSRLTPYTEDTIRDNQCGLRRSRSTTDPNSAFVKYLRKNGN